MGDPALIGADSPISTGTQFPHRVTRRLSADQ